MEKPNLNRMWETYVKLGLGDTLTMKKISDDIRSKVYPMLSDLYTRKIVKWYCFLIHDRKQQGDPNFYFHIRFEPKDGIDDKEHVNGILRDYCEKDKTARCNDVNNIQGIDESLLKNGIEDAWRIFGEQSEWLMNLLNIHKEDIKIPNKHLAQFMHFYLQPLGLGHKATLNVEGEEFNC